VAARRAGVLSWALSPVFFAAAALVTTFAPVPALGWTPAVVAEAGLAGDDLWSTEPQRGLAFGVLLLRAAGLLSPPSWKGRLAVKNREVSRPRPTRRVPGEAPGSEPVRA
jgi:hypothetical protein